MIRTAEDPPWLVRARREIGTKERQGPADNPRIVEYLASTRLAPRFLHDETPWCAAFVCWCLEGAGVASTRSAGARSYLMWGEELDEPRLGCVVVLSREDNSNPHAGHVGFYAGATAEGLLILGGNQANAVTVRRYSRARVLSCRWPRVA